MKCVFFSKMCAISAAIFGVCISFTVHADDCVMSVSQPVVDFGQTQRAQLLEGKREVQHLLVGTRVVNINFNCAADAAMALSFTGERVGVQGYRFAEDGFFTLRVLSAQLDGKSVHMMVRDAEGAVSNSDNQLRPGVSLVPGSTGHLARGSTLNVQVEVKTFVTDRDTLARSREQWEGSGQFSIDTL